MFLQHTNVGQIQTNCFLFGDEEAKVCALVDPGDEAPRLAKMVRDSGMTLQYILITHGHFDHCLAVPELVKLFPEVKVYANENEVDKAGFPNNYMQLPLVPNLNYYKEGDTLKLGDLEIKVLNTPGHSKGSMVLLVGEHMFAGDTLFAGGCGRTDFAGGSYIEMLASLKRLAQLEGDYKVYPGHESFTTLERERARNPYMQEALSR